MDEVTRERLGPAYLTDPGKIALLDELERRLQTAAPRPHPTNPSSPSSAPAAVPSLPPLLPPTPAPHHPADDLLVHGMGLRHFAWRFLLAREYNIDEAEAAALDCLARRQAVLEHRSVLWRRGPEEELSKLLHVHGRDHEGHPVIWSLECAGGSAVLHCAARTDIVRFRSTTIQETVLRHCSARWPPASAGQDQSSQIATKDGEDTPSDTAAAAAAGSAPKASATTTASSSSQAPPSSPATDDAAADTPRWSATVVLDAAGLGRTHLSREFKELYQTSTARNDATYPQSLRRLVVINAGLLVRMAYAVCRPFLSPRTLSKIHVARTSAAETLRKLLPEEALPDPYRPGKDGVVASIALRPRFETLQEESGAVVFSVPAGAKDWSATLSHDMPGATGGLLRVELAGDPAATKPVLITLTLTTTAAATTDPPLLVETVSAAYPVAFELPISTPMPATPAQRFQLLLTAKHAPPIATHLVAKVSSWHP